jgi:hypothetical protein
VRNTLAAPHTEHDGWNYSKSSSTAPPMLAQLKKIGWRKVKTCRFSSAKWFWPSIFPQHACWGYYKTKLSLKPVADLFDWSRWLAISSFSPLCSLPFTFMAKLKKERDTVACPMTEHHLWSNILWISFSSLLHFEWFKMLWES